LLKPFAKDWFRLNHENGVEQNLSGPEKKAQIVAAT